MIVTRHIAAMYDEAARLARALDETGKPEKPEWITDEHVEAMQKTLDRIDNLTTHARAELEDEYLRARDGWPVV